MRATRRRSTLNHSEKYVHMHRLSSWRGRGILAVRPDGYVGFRSTIVDQEMIRHWLTLLALGAR